MESKEAKRRSHLDNRFGWIIYFFRLAGIPLKMKKLSKIYAIYRITVIFCTFTTVIGMFVDVFIRWNDFGQSMTNIRLLMLFLNIIWVYIYCRYVRTLTVMFAASRIFVKKNLVLYNGKILDHIM